MFHLLLVWCGVLVLASLVLAVLAYVVTFLPGLSPSVRGVLVVSLVAYWTLWLQIPVTLTAILTFSGDISTWMARNWWAPVTLRLARAKLVADPLPNLDPKQPYIFMSNHQGYFDIPAACAVIPHNVRFVAKKSLGYLPILGWYLFFAGHVLIDRTNRSRAMRSLQKAGRKIAKGTSILVYPEGTRSPDGTIRPFKKGSFQLALAAQVPIVPVAVNGTRALMPKGGSAVYPGPVRIRLGEPIPTAGMTNADRDRLMHLVHDRLIDLHLAIGGEGGDRTRAVATADLPEKASAA